MNPVATAAEGSNWTRNFSYDACGNMWVSGYTGIGVAGNMPVSNVFEYRIGGGSYDVAGNQTVVNRDT